MSMYFAKYLCRTDIWRCELLFSLLSAAGANPSPGEKVARLQPGRKWNSGDNLLCGTAKDLLKLYVLLSLFPRSASNLSARIPLPPPSGHPLPGRGVIGRSRATATN